MRVALFVTCLNDQFLPRPAQAMVALLEHLGHGVEFPDQQTCCGQPMFNNGFHDEARRLARRFFDVFDGFEAVVTPSGSCAAMLRKHYPALFEAGSEDLARAQDLAARSFEFLEFLQRKESAALDQMKPQWEGVVTWHEACHLRDLGRNGDCERLLDRIRGLESRASEHREQCCGFGGTFAMAYPEISAGMVHDKVEAIRATGADTVVCNDGGCWLNIEGACERAGLDLRFVSAAEILAESLGLMERQP